MYITGNGQSKVSSRIGGWGRFLWHSSDGWSFTTVLPARVSVCLDDGKTPTLKENVFILLQDHLLHPFIILYKKQWICCMSTSQCSPMKPLEIGGFRLSHIINYTAWEIQLQALSVEFRSELNISSNPEVIQRETIDLLFPTGWRIW